MVASKEIQLCAGMHELMHWLYKGTPIIYNDDYGEWRLLLGNMELVVSRELMDRFTNSLTKKTQRVNICE